MDLELAGHVAVVTGGASGIGRACAERLAIEGCRVAVWDLNVTQQAGATGFAVDVSDYASVRRALASTETALGPVQHLVHAAARGSGKFGFPFTNLEPEDWRAVLDVNVMGTVHVAHACAPGMMARRSGTMVFLGSVAGQIGSQTDPPYSASKAANLNFAQCLAKDLAPHGICVNSLNPGMVRTPLNRAVWQAWHDARPVEDRRSYEEWAGDKVKSVSPLGQWQTPGDLADMAAFLSSARAARITGQSINVDGGQVMR